jgi:hypothetical protein
MQTARRKTVLGRALTVLPDRTPYLINVADALDVELIDRDQWLVSCDDEALVDGSNLAVVGSELLQFGVAEPQGQGRFRLTRLLRGRGGTEWAIQSHSVGEPFAMIERDALRAISLSAWASGSTITASARNVTGTSTMSPPIVVNGESLRPPSPVGLQFSVDVAGNITLAWTRRSRNGWAWTDEVDAPLGETVERYRVTVTRSLGSIERETDEPQLLISAAELAGIGAGAATVQVRQVGDWATSRPAECSLFT